MQGRREVSMKGTKIYSIKYKIMNHFEKKTHDSHLLEPPGPTRPDMTISHREAEMTLAL